MQALNIAATGMHAQQTNVEVISNNIANLSTTGFKRQKAAFEDLLYNNIVRPGVASSDVSTIIPSGIQLGAGVRTAGVYRINEQGTTQITDNQLDIAINGRGWFQVELPDGGTAYTRAGSFQMNAQGEIVTPQGYRILPGLVVPPDSVDITINASGQVFAKQQGQTDPANIGQIELASFANDAGLEAIGDNLLLETPASGTPTAGTAGQNGFGNMIQGSLESSNVDMVAEITNLITAQRAYEMNSKVIRAADEMMSTVNQLR